MRKDFQLEPLTREELDGLEKLIKTISVVLILSSIVCMLGMLYCALWIW